MSKKVKVLYLGDIHLGISNSSRLYMELSETVLDTIEKENIDIVMIVGDYFDKELVGSHKYYATKFFADLASLCLKNNIILRMIQGTKSHDQNQLVGFFGNTQTLLPDLDFKIILTAEEEELLGLKILYIPEEALGDQDSYYAPFKKKKYDIIAGHGTWDFVEPAKFLMGNNNIEKVASPVFLVEEWNHSVENGFVVFGHIHNGKSYKNKYFYTSSFTRYKFGEEEPKGFLISETDLDTREYKVTFIENKLAPTFQTILFEEAIGVNNLKDKSLIEVRKKLRELVDPKGEDKIRINVSDLTSNEITLLQKAAKTLDNIELFIRSKKAEEILLEEQEDDELDYVIHPEKYNMSYEDVIIKYAKDVNEENISMADLSKYIGEEVK